MKNTETMYIYNQYIYGTDTSLFWMKDDRNAMRWFVLIHIIDLAIDYSGILGSSLLAMMIPDIYYHFNEKQQNLCCMIMGYIPHYHGRQNWTDSSYNNHEEFYIIWIWNAHEFLSTNTPKVNKTDFSNQIKQKQNKLINKKIGMIFIDNIHTYIRRTYAILCLPTYIYTCT